MSLADGQPGLVQRHRRLAQHRLDPQPAAPEAGRVVRDELRVGRVERLDVVELLKNVAVVSRDQLGAPDAADLPAVAGPLARGDDPLLVADDDH